MSTDLWMSDAEMTPLEKMPGLRRQNLHIEQNDESQAHRAAGTPLRGSSLALLRNSATSYTHKYDWVLCFIADKPVVEPQRNHHAVSHLTPIGTGAHRRIRRRPFPRPLCPTASDLLTSDDRAILRRYVATTCDHGIAFAPCFFA